VPADLNGDLRLANLSLLHTCNDAALGQGEMRCREHIPQSAKASKLWLIASQRRTHPCTKKMVN